MLNAVGAHGVVSVRPVVMDSDREQLLRLSSIQKEPVVVVLHKAVNPTNNTTSEISIVSVLNCKMFSLLISNVS